MIEILRRRAAAATGLLATALMLLVLAPPASGAVAPNVLAAAKKEGTVVWYTSTDADTFKGIIARFERAYPGIHVDALRLTSNLIPVRIITEQRGDKYNVDVANGDIIPMSQLEDVGALQPYAPPDPNAWVKGAIDPKGMWVSLYFDTTVLSWNPQKAKADGLPAPTSVDDLTKPQWKGKFALDSTAYNWYQGMLEIDPNAAELVKKLVANQPLITQGHTNTVMQMESGEFDATPTAYGYLADKDHRAGRPVAFVNPKPLLVGLGPVGLVKNAPHPNAARVFMDWLLSKDGQQAFVDLSGRPSARLDVRNNPAVFNPKLPIHIIGTPDPARYKEIVSQYKSLLGVQ